MAFRQTSRAFIRLVANTQQRAIPSLRNTYILRNRYIYEVCEPNMCYTQKRNIFWNEKEKKGEETKTENTQEQTENKTEQTEQTQKTQEKAAEQQKTTTQTQSKQSGKERTLAQQFEDVISDFTPEQSSKLNALWKKLEQQVEAANKEARRIKEQADNLEKVNADNKQKVDTLRAKVKEEIDERELMRKRMEKEIDNAKIYAITKFAKDLIETPDNLGRALEAARNLEGTGDNLYEGVKATNNILLKTLARHGITQLNPIGVKFDPNYHEALFDIPDPNARPGTCGFVASVGYQINDRVLRPAKVGVVRGDYIETEEEKEAREAQKKEKSA